MRELVIIGAGAAGMTAAVTAKQAGLEPLLVDTYSHAGGHYYKQAATQEARASRRQTEFNDLQGQLKKLAVECWQSANVWSVVQDPEAGDFQVHIEHQAKSLCVHARYLLLCTGAYDRPLIFENWHLPGVMTLGGAQMLLKGQSLVPGKNVMVAGSGPLLLAVAAALAKAGANVRAVLDTASYTQGLGSIAGLVGQPEKLQDASDYLLTLLRHRIPIKCRHTIFRVEGQQRVERVIYGKVDAQGKPLWQTAQVAEVDAICASAGFLPNIAMSKHLGCEHHFNPQLDAHFPKHDKNMQTSVNNLYVAGDITTVGGKEHAKLQGELAALAIVQQVNKLSTHDFNRNASLIRHKLEREQRFLSLIHARMKPLAQLHELMTDDTYICRC
ncbi:MAG: FAD-dependent oxidoreductase, partial [Deinococcota bacterium]